MSVRRDSPRQITVLQGGASFFRFGSVGLAPSYGDILIKFAGEDAIDSVELSKQVSKYAGQTADIEVIRGDQTKVIPVQLRPNL